MKADGDTSATEQAIVTANLAAFSEATSDTWYPVVLLHPKGYCSLGEFTYGGQALHLPAEPGQLLAFFARQALTFTPVDLLLEDSSLHRLLDKIELFGHVGDAALLVKDQGTDVPTELLRTSPSPAHRRWFHFGHSWLDYLQFEVSANGGLVTRCRRAVADWTGHEIARSPSQVDRVGPANGTMAPVTDVSISTRSRKGRSFHTKQVRTWDTEHRLQHAERVSVHGVFLPRRVEDDRTSALLAVVEAGPASDPKRQIY